MNSSELYKRIVKEPYVSHNYKWYEAEFSGLMELYEYLKSDPEINSYAFSNLASQVVEKDNNKSLYGMSYIEALNYLLGGYKQDLDKLFYLKKQLETVDKIEVKKTKVVRSFTGSRICINGFIANSPKKFYRLERIDEKKFVTINANLTCRVGNDKNQFLHRGALLYNLVDTLESNNYSVALNTFMLFKKEDELIYIKVHLKNPNSPLSIDNTLFPLTSVAFLRRLIFRVMESMPVKVKEWGQNYGFEVVDTEAKELLNIPRKDIFVGTPNQIGITGVDLEEDAKKFLNYIDMDSYTRVMKR